jgi:hypothetical protein
LRPGHSDQFAHLLFSPAHLFHCSPAPFQPLAEMETPKEEWNRRSGEQVTARGCVPGRDQFARLLFTPGHLFHCSPALFRPLAEMDTPKEEWNRRSGEQVTAGGCVRAVATSSQRLLFPPAHLFHCSPAPFRPLAEMEAAGIEPASCDPLATASTCVFRRLISPEPGSANNARVKPATTSLASAEVA